MTCHSLQREHDRWHDGDTYYHGAAGREKAGGKMAGIILLGINLMLIIASFIFTGLMRYMPYLTGAFISALICASVPASGTSVPGPQGMTFLLVLIAVEAGIFILMHIPQVGGAFSLILSELFIAVSGSLILQKLQPDSLGYCLLVTVCYLAVSTFFLISNLRCGRNFTGSRPEKRAIPVRLLVTVLYVCTGIVMLAVPVKYLWMNYYGLTI